MSTVTVPEASGLIVAMYVASVPCSSEALPFRTTKSSSSKPVTGTEKAIVMGKGPVTD